MKIQIFFHKEIDVFYVAINKRDDLIDKSQEMKTCYYKYTN